MGPIIDRDDQCSNVRIDPIIKEIKEHHLNLDHASLLFDPNIDVGNRFKHGRGDLTSTVLQKNYLF